MSKARELASLGNAYSDGALSNRRLNHNGDMRIAQRGSSAVTPTSSASLYPVDRWGAYSTPSSKYSAQQQTGGPSGFDNYVRITSLSAHTSASTDFFPFFTNLEGQDVQQLQYGSSNAKDVTISFWVRSSLTGTFSVGFRAASASTSYATTYTISAANTWEYKTITVAGNTSTSIANNNLLGFDVNFDIGHGSSQEATANTWVAGNKCRVSGTVRLVETNGATLDITGVQLEVGDTATPFEHRSYGQELALCQRYFQKIGGPAYTGIGSGINFSNIARAISFNYITEMRANPSGSIEGTLIVSDRTGFDTPVSSIASFFPSTNSASIQVNKSANSGTNYYPIQLAVANGTTGYVVLDAEL